MVHSRPFLVQDEGPWCSSVGSVGLGAAASRPKSAPEEPQLRRADPPGPTKRPTTLICVALQFSVFTFTYPGHCFGMCISLPNTLLADCTMQLHSAQCTVQCTAAQCNCRVQAVHSAPQHNATAHLESGISGSATKIPPQVRELPFKVKKK